MTKKIVQIGLSIFILVLVVLFFVADPSKSVLFPRCVFNSLTGYYCPGCGSQRAIHSLLHFNLAGVVQNNFLLLPAIVLIIYHYSRALLNRKFNWNFPNIFYFKKTPWIILAVIILFWILRNVPYYPFLILAPH